MRTFRSFIDEAGGRLGEANDETGKAILGRVMTERAESDGDSSHLSGRTILLVEDEALVAMELQFRLELKGAKVVGPAATLEDALAAAREASFEAAILDVNLGGLDVFPVADILCDKAIPFLFYTGHGRRTELAVAYPDAPVCQKPLSSDDVFDVLAGLL